MSIQRASFFNRDDCCANFLEIREGGLSVKYVGRGRDDLEAAAVRSDHPLTDDHSPIFYFEVEIVNAGRDGYMSVGLMGRKCHLDKLVGWGEESVGYHGDDGCLFKGAGMGKPFGPVYTTGDVVGCGVDRVRSQVFFTLNGRVVGAVADPGEREWFAAVGLRTPGETMSARFKGPFKFNIQQYTSELRSFVVEAHFKNLTLKSESVVEAIFGHLLFYGHFAALNALLEAFPERRRHYDPLVSSRSGQLAIVDGILNGSELDFPSILASFPNANDQKTCALFHICCFVNMAFCSNRSDLAQLLRLADTVDATKLPEINYEQHVWSVLSFRDPQSSPLSHLLMFWRESFVDHLNEVSGIQSPLMVSLQRLKEKIQADCERRQGKRIWSLLDDAQYWLGDCLD